MGSCAQPVARRAAPPAPAPGASPARGRAELVLVGLGPQLPVVAHQDELLHAGGGMEEGGGVERVGNQGGGDRSLMGDGAGVVHGRRRGRPPRPSPARSPARQANQHVRLEHLGRLLHHEDLRKGGGRAAGQHAPTAHHNVSVCAPPRRTPPRPTRGLSAATSSWLRATPLVVRPTTRAARSVDSAAVSYSAWREEGQGSRA